MLSMRTLHGSISTPAIVRPQQSLIFLDNGRRWCRSGSSNDERMSGTMTFAEGFYRFEDRLVQRMRASFDEARRQHRMRQVYRQTYDELNALTERELDDLGLARGDISGVARDAAEAQAK